MEPAAVARDGMDADNISVMQSELMHLKRKYERECTTRRELLNQLTEAKGNIRVLARIRPLQEAEEPSPLDVLDESTIYAPLYSIQAPSTATTSNAIPILTSSVSAPSLSAMLPSASSASLTTSQSSALSSLNKKYQFDRVLGQKSTQAEIYDEVSTLPASLLDGYNCCLFAYGQTGSGKTFTMEGTPNEPGLNSRLLQNLFDESKQREHMTFDFHVSILEIYNEVILDLLDQRSTASSVGSSLASGGLKLRQGERGVYVQDAIRTKVTCFSQVKEAMDIASKVRTVCTTEMNDRSSRSHCITCLEVNGRKTLSASSASSYNSSSDDTVTFSRLYLIDLAGSERVGQSGAQGKALDEAKHINKSLSALARVMECLQLKRQHIPFRDSTLTHLLKDSLVEAKTTMVLNLSPASISYGQSVNSLNFGVRVRKIERVAPKKNFDIDRERFNANKAELESEIATLKAENTRLNAQATQLRADHAADSNGLKLKHSTQLLALQQQMQQLIATHAQEMAALKSSHSQEISSLRKALADATHHKLLQALAPASKKHHHHQTPSLTSSTTPYITVASVEILPPTEKENVEESNPPSESDNATAKKKYVHQTTPIKPKRSSLTGITSIPFDTPAKKPTSVDSSMTSDFPVMDENGILLPVVMTPQIQKKPIITTASPLGLLGFDSISHATAKVISHTPSILDDDSILTTPNLEVTAMSPENLTPTPAIVVPSPIPPPETPASTQLQIIGLSSSQKINKSCFLDRTIQDRPKKSVSFSEIPQEFVADPSTVVRRPPLPHIMPTQMYSTGNRPGTATIRPSGPSPASPIKATPLVRTSAPSTSVPHPGARRVVAKPSTTTVSASSIPKATPGRLRPVGRTTAPLAGPTQVYKTY